MRRMVKTTPNANHKAVTQSVICSTTHISAQTNFSDPKLHFRLPNPYPSNPKELPHLLPHSTNTQAPTFALTNPQLPKTKKLISKKHRKKKKICKKKKKN